MSVRVYEVPFADVDQMAPFIAPWLLMAAERSQGQVTVTELMRGILDGEQTPWLVYDASGLIGCVTTAVVKLPGRWIAEIVSAAVDAPEVDWMPEVDRRITAWARQYGCEAIEATGRVGWGKALKPYGYRQTFMTVGKELSYAEG